MRIAVLLKKDILNKIYHFPEEIFMFLTNCFQHVIAKNHLKLDNLVCLNSLIHFFISFQLHNQYRCKKYLINFIANQLSMFI